MSALRRTLVLGTLLVVSSLALATASPATAQPTPDSYKALHWRFIGPEGNRFSAAASIPGDPFTYYVGSASGGIYKTTDGGKIR